MAIFRNGAVAQVVERGNSSSPMAVAVFVCDTQPAVLPHRIRDSPGSVAAIESIRPCYHTSAVLDCKLMQFNSTSVVERVHYVKLLNNPISKLTLPLFLEGTRAPYKHVTNTN